MTLRKKSSGECWGIWIQNTKPGMSLAVQWFRLHLPIPGVRVQSLVRKLRSHMPKNQNIKNRSNIVTNFIKTLRSKSKQTPNQNSHSSSQSLSPISSLPVSLQVYTGLPSACEGTSLWVTMTRWSGEHPHLDPVRVPDQGYQHVSIFQSGNGTFGLRKRFLNKGFSENPSCPMEKWTPKLAAHYNCLEDILVF